MKKLLIVLGALVLLTAAGFGAVSWWIMQKLGPEVWVEQAEAHWNCRAHIDDAALSLFPQPAKLMFKGVRLARRDAEVAKPLAQRAPLADDSSVVLIPELVLEVKLEDLLKRRLFIERLRILAPVVREVQDPETGSSLEALFQSPETASAAAQAPDAKRETAPPPAAALPTATGTEPRPAGAREPAASSGGFAYAVQQASLERGSLDITSGTTRVQIQDLDLRLSGIDIDPADLAGHNRMRAELKSRILVTGMARIGGSKRPAELARLALSGDGEIRPLDPKTGRWRPTTDLRLTLAKESVLAGHLTIGDAAGKDLRKLQQYGIDLAPVRIGGPLMQDALVSGQFRNDRFTIRQPALFVFPDYEVALEPKSWIEAARDRHEIDLRLSCGPALQTRLTEGIAKAGLGESMARGVSKALADERGRMTFDIESAGALSNPKVEPKTDRVLKNLLRGEGLGDLLQGLLKKL